MVSLSIPGTGSGPTISATPAEPGLPPLREDIRLLPGPRAADGNRSWLINDPVRNAFFRIGWREFAILSHWGTGSPAAVAEAANRDSTVDTDEAEVTDVARFLVENELIVLGGASARSTWTRRVGALRHKSFSRLFQENLFLRIPLVDPDRFLTATMPLARVFFTPGFRTLTIVVALAGLFLAGREWDRFVSTFPYFFSVSGAVVYALALSFAKVIHELGHAYAAKREGLRVPSMGLAFLVMWPVLFTDTTDSWRLQRRHQRFVVAGAGMAAEVALAAWALLLWSLVPAGAVQSALFALATATWLMTLAVNLNPLIRFDGYFLLSDAMGIENLMPRAFAVLRHWVRTVCIGLDDADPEPALDGPTKRAMAGYAVGVIVHRVALIVGIGLILYYFAFKLLGIAAFATVLLVMIGQPTLREIRRQAKSGGRVIHPLRLVLFLLVLGGIGGALVYPWSGTVSAPAIRKADAESRLYPPFAAHIVRLDAHPGDRVRKGQVLAVLDSPELRFQLRAAEARADSVRLLVERIQFRQDIADQAAVARERLASVTAEITGYRAQLAALTLRAPFDGTVSWVATAARAGAWMRPTEPLALVVAPTEGLLTAYLDESDLARVADGDRGRFYAFGDTGAPLPVRVLSISPSASATIPDRPLASVDGGPIPTRPGRGGRALPDDAWYETRLAVDGPAPATTRELTGIVKLDARPESLLTRAWRQVKSVAIRESGL